MSAEPRRLTPTERLHELALAIATKQPSRGSESVTIKQATVGDLKGRWVCDGLTVVRAEGEELDAFNARWRRMLATVDEELLHRNADSLRSALAQSVAQAKEGKAK